MPGARISILSLCLALATACSDTSSGDTTPPVEVGATDVVAADADLGPPTQSPPIVVPPKLWALDQIDVQGAWQKTRGDRKVKVAVLDDGIDYRNQALAPNMWLNPCEDHPPLHEVDPGDFDGKDDACPGEAGNGLADDLFARMEHVYGQVLPGYGPASSTVADGVFFVIGPDKQLDAYQKYLAATYGKDTKLWRLYPRDFWVPAKP